LVLAEKREQSPAVIIRLTGTDKLVLIRKNELRGEVDPTKKNKVAIKKTV
jgi:hypothetical protein